MYISDEFSDIPEETEKELSDKLGVLHRRINKLKIPVIIVFEGWYDSYIAEIINRQILPLDPRGYDFHFTEFPTRYELQKPYIWRFMKKIPPEGKLAIFDRSWYIRGLLEYVPLYEFQKDCLLEHVKNLDFTEESVKKSLEKTDNSDLDKEDVEDVSKSKAFKSLVRQINFFEKGVSQEGYVFIKIYLGVKPEEKKRIVKTLKNDDLIFEQEKKRKAREKIYYEDLELFKILAAETDTEYAPWNIILIDDDIDLSVRRTMKVIADRMEEAIQNR
ncbi:MAG: hypothetical protein GX362_06285 [Methanosarcinaceae archaeon]|nr:hypothetical protein [Methanosarcinaceae archaeon]